MKSRLVVVTIDSILELMKDYLGPEAIPPDAWPQKLMIKPTEQGKFAIVAASDGWPQGLAPLEVKFEIRRLWGVS
jgi:hypothetical protein